MRVLGYGRLAFALGFAATGALALTAGAVAQGRGATVPTDVQMPGTQPEDVLTDLHDPYACSSCHGNFNTDTEPFHLWRGSMMSHASRDPIFWATLAIAEQDFAGGGDFCLRCHVPSGWLAGRSVPTDGAALDTTRDVHGVECDQCHRLTNPDNSEFLGVQNPPFVANSGGPTPVGYYGSGQYVMWNGPPNGPPYGPSKLGPYASTAAPHSHSQSLFHRSSDLCGTCHDVSNPFTGDLAPGNGAQVPLAPGTFSGVPGTPVDGKAAFNNFPYQYGVVERTLSEHRASAIDTLPVSQFGTLPAELQQGALAYAREQALQAGTGGNFADGTTRYFTCQTCHMAPTIGEGCGFGAPTRSDLARHDLTGGNYWMPDAIQWLDQQGLLILGGGLTPGQVVALNDGKARARESLSRAAALSVTGNTLRVVNLTGHKLITGYPEGRRMWVNARWYDSQGGLLREDGAYGALTVAGLPAPVRTLLDLTGTNTRIYESHGGISQAWAQKLIDVLGVSPSLVVAFDRVSGLPTTTLADVAAQAPGTAHESFHFLLNDTVMADNRIPPYGMAYDEARTRNALPVPSAQFGSPGPGGTYEYFDQVPLNPPPGASYATFDLLYQPTSWEYVQFLWKANTGSVVRLAQEGVNLRDAWLNTGMAEPHRMASTTWGAPPALSAGDCEVLEGNAGTATCAFTVTLAPASSQTVSVAFATADGTATVAGNDYVAASGTVTFPPGSVTQTVEAQVNGDGAPEPNETFTLALSGAVNAAIADGTGTGTILNDETPTASIGDCTVVEGNAGNSGCVATVTLDVPSTQLPIVEYTTIDFTATAGPDYVASGSFLSFQPGVTSQNVTIPVVGDLLPEIDETFLLRLMPVSGASIGDGEGVGTIVDDDGLAGGVAELSHGVTITTDLAAQSAGVADLDLYLIAQQPYSSYEVIVDATSGDLGSAGPLVERRGAVVQPSSPVGTGPSRALRWMNLNGQLVAGEQIVVSAPQCGTDCGPDDVYRIRAYDTTYSIPRFNNTGSQVTVVILQNLTDRPVQARLFFWTPSGGTLPWSHLTMTPRQLHVLSTASIVPDQGGSITVVHDGGYGALSGKAVALEPSTGFSFDSPMIPRPR